MIHEAFEQAKVGSHARHFQTVRRCLPQMDEELVHLFASDQRIYITARIRGASFVDLLKKYQENIVSLFIKRNF